MRQKYKSNTGHQETDQTQQTRQIVPQKKDDNKRDIEHVQMETNQNLEEQKNQNLDELNQDDDQGEKVQEPELPNKSSNSATMIKVKIPTAGKNSQSSQLKNKKNKKVEPGKPKQKPLSQAKPTKLDPPIPKLVKEPSRNDPSTSNQACPSAKDIQRQREIEHLHHMKIIQNKKQKR
ncbi:hypothetical protein SESBI_04602 [Sesbania bispinosa]|nr:hypothetical protein SESBI_04602 [Sesbania bispinosa]